MEHDTNIPQEGIMKVSITLPSIFPEACARAIKNIRETTLGDYEIVVVSPFDPGTESGRVLWLPDSKEKKGAAVCQHRAANAATGEIVAAFADDFLFTPGWDKMIVADFLDREKQAPADKPFVLGMRYNLCGFVGSLFGIYYANFPVMRRTVVKKHGWISPDYRAGFGDGDLGMRTWAAGGRCEFSVDKVLIVTPDDQRKGGSLFTDDDMKLFVKRWATFSKGWDVSHIRGFNMEICPEEHPEVLDSTKRTVYHNDPSYVNKVMTEVPPYIVETIDNKNLVMYRRRVYAIPHSLGSVDMANENLVQLRAGITSYDSIIVAREALTGVKKNESPKSEPKNELKAVPAVNEEAPPKLVGTISSTNIVEYMNKVFTIPQSLGPLDLTRNDHRHKCGIVVFTNITEAKEWLKRRR
jgi:hypothetical protein